MNQFFHDNDVSMSNRAGIDCTKAIRSVSVRAAIVRDSGQFRVSVDSRVAEGIRNVGRNATKNNTDRSVVVEPTGNLK